MHLKRKKRLFYWISIFSVSGTILLSLVCTRLYFNPMVITSRSMVPSLHVGDVVFIERGFNPNEIKTGGNGDIIAIDNYSIFTENGVPEIFFGGLNPNTPIIHRAIDKVEDNGTIYFITKGDNNQYPDGCFRFQGTPTDNYSMYEFNRSNPVPVPARHVIGAVVLKIPWIGYLKIHAGYVYVYLGSMMILVYMHKRRKEEWKRNECYLFTRH